MPPIPASIELCQRLREVWRGDISARLEVTPSDRLEPGERAAVWVTANTHGQSMRIYLLDRAYGAAEHRDVPGGSRERVISLGPAPRSAQIGLRAIAEVAAKALLGH
jgi:hypothetical protein